jgi:hypothetical protein
MTFKPSIHQLAALWWVMAGAVFLLPLATISTKADAWHLILCDIAAVTAIIALVPVALKWRAFRRWFCWTDAFSDRERRLIAARDASAYYREAYAQRYAQRVLPYALRIMGANFAVDAVQWLVPDDMEVAKAVLASAGFYPIGVTLLIIAALPIGEYLRRARHRKR